MELLWAVNILPAVDSYEWAQFEEKELNSNRVYQLSQIIYCIKQLYIKLGGYLQAGAGLQDVEFLSCTYLATRYHVTWPFLYASNN